MAYDSFVAIFCGRSIAGISHGIVYITTISHLAENVVKEIRGRALSITNYMIVTSIFAAVALASSLESAQIQTSDMYIGIISIVYVSMGLLFNPFLTYESIPFLLKKGLDQEALQTMMKLRNETFETWTIRNDFQEIKQMINDEVIGNLNIFSKRNLKPLSLMAGTRVLSFLTSNIILNTIMLYLMQTAIKDHMSGFYLSGARFIIAVIPLLTMDSVRRKKQLTVTGAIAGTLILIYAVLVAGFQLDKSVVWLSITIFILFQIIVSLGIDPLHHVLMSEAFSTNSKSYWSITFVTTIESLLQIMAIILAHVLIYSDMLMYGVMFGTATGILVLHLILEFYLPETAGLTLRQAKLKFQRGGEILEYSGSEFS